jgi:hypothetical protein
MSDEASLLNKARADVTTLLANAKKARDLSESEVTVG